MIELQELKDMARDWDDLHQVVEFTTDVIDPENKIFLGLPYKEIGTVSHPLGMPAKFAKELSHDLVRQNLSYLATVKQVRERARAVITGSGISGIVFNKGEASISALQVVEGLETVLAQESYPWVVESHSLVPENESRFFWLNVVRDDVAYDVLDDLKPTQALDRGDPIKSGFSLLHDISAEENTKIETLIYRLVCQNGMVTAERGSKWSIRHEEMVSHLVGRIKFLEGFADTVMSRFAHSRHTVLSDPLSSAASLIMELKLPKPVRTDLLLRLEQTPPVTYYDLINAITAAANTATLEDRRSVQVKVGAMVASLPNMCDACHQVIH